MNGDRATGRAPTPHRINGDASETGPATRRAGDAAMSNGSRGSTRLRAAVLTLDGLSVTAGWIMGALAVDPSPQPRTGQHIRTVLLFAGLVPLALLVNRSFRLYRASAYAVRALEIGALARASATTAVVMLALAQVLDVDVAELWVAASALLGFAIQNVARWMLRLRLAKLREKGRAHVRPVVIVGANDEAFDLWQLLCDHPEVGYRVCGVVGRRDEHDRHTPWAPWLGEADDGAVQRVLESGARGVFIAPTAISCRYLNTLCRELLASQVHVQVASSLRGIDVRRVMPHPVAHEAMYYVQPATLSRRQEATKRVCDTVVGFVALLVTLPVMLLAALAILVFDGRPILFRQFRIGRNGVPFTIYKFRTMVVDAETKLIDLVEGNERTGPLFKLDDDPRVTRVGRFLRDTSIDELPQLLNVLRGTMSLVGPRPALPIEIALFDDELRARHRVKPGITGLWQVHCRDKASFTSYKRLDLFYVENWSVTMDLAVLALTVPAVLTRSFDRLVSRRNTDATDDTPGGLTDIAPDIDGTEDPARTIAPALKSPPTREARAPQEQLELPAVSFLQGIPAPPGGGMLLDAGPFLTLLPDD